MSDYSESEKRHNDLFITLNKKEEIVSVGTELTTNKKLFKKIYKTLSFINFLENKKQLTIPKKNPIEKHHYSLIKKNKKNFKPYIKVYKTENNEIFLIETKNSILEIVPPKSELILFKDDELESKPLNTKNPNFSHIIDDNIIEYLNSNKSNISERLKSSYAVEKIPNNHVGLLKKKGEIKEALVPGTYYLWITGNTPELSLYNTSSEILVDESIYSYISKNKAQTIEFKPETDQVAIIYKYGRVIDFKLPNTKGFYWNLDNSTKVGYFYTSHNCTQEIQKLLQSNRSDSAANFLNEYLIKKTIPWGHSGYLSNYSPSNQTEPITLPVGDHYLWEFNKPYNFYLVDLRPKVKKINDVKVESNDSISFSIDFLVNWQMKEDNLPPYPTLEAEKYIEKEIIFEANRFSMDNSAQKFIQDTSKEEISREIYSQISNKKIRESINIEHIVIVKIKKPFSIEKEFNEIKISNIRKKISS